MSMRGVNYWRAKEYITIYRYPAMDALKLAGKDNPDLAKILINIRQTVIEN